MQHGPEIGAGKSLLGPEGDENMGRPQGAKTRPGRAKLRFKQSEVARAVKGAKLGGLEPTSVRLTPTGDIIIGTSKSLEGNAGGGELEDWMAKHAGQIARDQ